MCWSYDYTKRFERASGLAQGEELYGDTRGHDEAAMAAGSSNGKIIFFAVLIVIQAVAAAFAAAKSHKGTDPAFTVILLALVVTVATGIREILRDISGPQYRAGREVIKSHNLLIFMSDRFPQLMNKLTKALTANTVERRSEIISALKSDVVTATSGLFPNVVLRVAIFWSNGSHFNASSYFLGWEKEPACPGQGIDDLIRKTLEDETCIKA